MSERTDRRAFFRSFVSDIARGVQEITAPVATPAAAPEPASASGRGRLPGTATTAPVTIGELIDLAAGSGLGQRRDAVRELCRPSVRLTRLAPGEAPSRSRLGGTPELPPSMAWPHAAGRPLSLLAQLDLADVAAALGGDGPLPHHGTLWCFHETERTPSGMHLRDAEACVVAFDPEDPALLEPRPAPLATLGGHAAAVALSAELTLPRVGSAAVEALQLHAHEQRAWQQLRRRLAELQGVELADESPGLLEIHRLIGWSDERRGDMPLACELLAQGVEVGEQPPTAHPRAAEAALRVQRWRPLLQLTLDDALGWDWGGARERLYLWIDEADLAARDFSRVRAIPQ